jgi:hypothetical protein
MTIYAAHVLCCCLLLLAGIFCYKLDASCMQVLFKRHQVQALVFCLEEVIKELQGQHVMLCCQANQIMKSCTFQPLHSITHYFAHSRLYSSVHSLLLQAASLATSPWAGRACSAPATPILPTELLVSSAPFRGPSQRQAGQPVVSTN